MTEIKIYLGRLLLELQWALENELDFGYDFENDTQFEYEHYFQRYRKYIKGEIPLKRYIISDSGVKAHKRAKKFEASIKY